MKLLESLILSLLALNSAQAAEYLYEKDFKKGAVGVIELHPINTAIVNSAPLCAQFLVNVKISKVHERGTSILQSFEGISGSDIYFFTVENFYDKFPNATREEYKNFIKVGNSIYVAYQECGRSPVKHPLSIFLAK